MITGRLYKCENSSSCISPLLSVNRCAVAVIKDTDLSLTLCVLKSLTTPPDVLKSACLEVQSKSDANVLTE